MGKYVIGIDPGANGGIAWFEDGAIQAAKIPDTLAELWELIDGIRWNAIRAKDARDGDKVIAYIEKVHSSPQMGVTSSFTFGRGLGNLEMAVTAASIGIEWVSPQRWQKAMGCLTRGDKNVSKRRAMELFPAVKVTHSIADALLIAEWGRRQP